MMICSNCGKELSDTAKFCGGCGTPVKAAEKEPTVSETQPSAANSEPQTSAASVANEEKETSTAESSKPFTAAGSGSNPFASVLRAINSQVDQANASANATPFSGNYAASKEADGIAAQAKKAAEQRAAARASRKEKAEERRGKKPVIAGFAVEDESEKKEIAPFATGLPSWDLVPATPTMVNRSTR